MRSYLLTQLAAIGLTGFRFDLAFWPDLERRYRSDTASARARQLRQVSVLGAVVYCIVGVILNGLVCVDTVWSRVAVELCVTPAIGLLIAWRWFRSSTPDAVREAAAVASCLVYTVSVIMAVYADPPRAAAQNLMLVTLPVNFVLIFVQLRLRQATIFVAAALALHATAALARHDLPLQTECFAIAFLAALCVPTLFATYNLERGARGRYLHGLQQRYYIEHLAAEREALATLSDTDPLTGTANRRRLDAALKRHCGSPAVCGAFMLIDVDDFKAFNDRHGHVAGDLCLKEIASRIAGQLRPGDLLARFGGEEFAILVPGMQEAEALIVAERVRSTVESHRFSAHGNLLGVTVSIGIAKSAAFASPAALIEAADTALYVAKNGGRNRVHAAWLDAVARAA